MKLALSLTLAVALGALMASPAYAAGGVYVALGDSYTSAPLVPNQHGQPIDVLSSPQRLRRDLRRARR